MSTSFCDSITAALWKTLWEMFKTPETARFLQISRRQPLRSDRIRNLQFCQPMPGESSPTHRRSGKYLPIGRFFGLLPQNSQQQKT